MLAVSWTAQAQTLATGDTRTVVEPTIPPSCTTLAAQQAIVSGAPASETTLDTTRIQAALTACPAGQVVELTSSGTNYAFLTGALTLPTGVGLLVDGGVTVFGSRNPGDYQTTSTEKCGTFGPSGNGCYPLIALAKNGSGQGLYGYGVIDARGGSTMLGGPNPGESWWTNADNSDGLGSQDNPIILSGSSTNLTLYKITLRNSPEFHVAWSGTGLTVWGVKISAPYTAHNTDGIDPTGSNVTIMNSSISDGDDNIAVGASSPSANVTISNVNTYSGHGLSVGSYTSGGLTNYLAENINMAGTAADGNSTGLRLKSAADRGGLLNTLTYENVCIRDTRYPIQLNPLYNTNAGTEIPQYKNIVYQNVHVLAPTSTNTYAVQLQGYDANHVSTVTFNNLVFDQLTAAQVTPAPQDITIALAGNVYPSFLTSLTGTGVSYTGSASSIAGAGVSSCSKVFPYIVGELYGSTATATNLQSASIPDTGSITLNAMVEPAMSQTTYAGTSGTWAGTAAPANPISFYDGSTLVGTGTLGANGTIASLTITNPTAGTHTYTAQYPGDTNYAAITFGSVKVTVQGPAVTSTTALVAPATLVYGAALPLSATVTGSGGTPSGTVTFLDGTTVLGTSQLASGVATFSATGLLGGSHSLTASYGGDLVFMPSTSSASTLTITPGTSTTAVTANPTTVAVGTSSAFSATVTGLTGGAIPTGQILFTDGTANLGSATLTSAGKATFTGTLSTAGTRTVNACYGGDSNYAASCGMVSLTVTQTPTTVALLLTPPTVYPGGTVLFAATVNPAVAGTTVTFLIGTTSVGTGVTNAAGVATFTWTSGILGTFSATASAAANGNYAASVSPARPLNVVNPYALQMSPPSIAVTAGTTGNAVFSLQPGGGFSGSITLTCVPSVAYVTCSLPLSVVSVSGTLATTVNATVGVNLRVSELRRPGSGMNLTWAILAPLGLIGLFGARRKLRRAPLLLLLLTGTALASISGCSGSAGTTPTGSQTLLVTAVGGGLTQTLTITVNID